MRRRDRPLDRWLIEYLKENAAFRRYVLRELEQPRPSALARDRRSRADSAGGAPLVGRAQDGADARHPERARRGRRRRTAGQAADLGPRRALVSARRRRCGCRRPKRLLLERRRRALGVWLEKGRLHVHPEADDRAVPARTTLLGPFDRLIHDRDRAEALWDFLYRIEIYVPAAKREYGYYVLPILHGDRLIGRLDPVHDKKAGVLRVNAVYAEPGAPADAWPAVRAALDDLANGSAPKRSSCRGSPGPGANGHGVTAVPGRCQARAWHLRRPRIGSDGLRDARDPRGAGAGSRHRRRDGADLPDLDLRPGGGRRPQGLRLLARRQPDADGAPAVPRLARERRPRHRLLVRARRDDDAHAPRQPGRARRLRERRLRRRLPHVLAGLRAEGLRVRPTSPRRR